MKRWAQISNGVVITVVEQETVPTVPGIWIECSLHVNSGCIYNDGQFSPAPTPPIILSQLQMINKLGNDYISIVETSKTDVEVEVWLEKFRLQTSFNLSEQSTKDQIQFLVTKNLITQAKANEILNMD